MSRWMRTALLGAAVAVTAVAPAHAATWTAVSGLIPGRAASASIDGARVLVASLTGNRSVVASTIAGGRVARRQVVGTGARPGTIRYVQVSRLRRGRALVVWQEPGVIRASLRPSAGAPFSPAVTVSRFPGTATGAVLAPALAVGPTGEAVVAFLGGPAGGRLGIQTVSLEPGSRQWTAPAEISGGLFPQFPGAGVSAPVPIASAADPAGGFAVAWGQGDVLAVTRAPAGAWTSPARLGSGGARLALTAPAPGDLVAGWLDAACVHTATLRGMAAGETTLACRPGTLGGAIRLSRTAAGGAVVAVQFVLQPAAASSQIEVAARDALGAWGPMRLAIAGSADLRGAVPSNGDRTTVPAVLGSAFNRVRVALAGPDGIIQRRLDGPSRPTPPRHTSVDVLPLGPGARVALLLTPTPTRAAQRASLLTLGP